MHGTLRLVPVFISSLVWNISDHLHYESVYFKDGYTTSKNTIDRQYTERGQLYCQLFLVNPVMLYLNYLQLFVTKYSSGVPINQLDKPSALPTINKPLRLTERLCSTYEIPHGFKPFTDVQKRKCNLTKKGYYTMRTHLLNTVEAVDVRCAFFRRKKNFFSVSRKV